MKEYVSKLNGYVVLSALVRNNCMEHGAKVQCFREKSNDQSMKLGSDRILQPEL